MYLIRAFSQRVECPDVEALECTLQSDFLGQSVSIQFTRPSGMAATIFVDVQEGGVVQSYGEQRPINLRGIAVSGPEAAPLAGR